MRIDIAAQSDTGKRKRINEDCYGVFREDTPGLQLFKGGALLCVADGLGGHVGGQIASKLSVSIIKEALTHTSPPGSEEDGEGLLSLLREAFRYANQSVYRTNLDLVKNSRPMGTTLLATLITPRKVYVCNVGDSRCYQFRQGKILNRTEDHSWIDEQVKLGLMSKSEADTDARRHIVTRSIGTQPEVEVDCYTWDVSAGDLLLVCTDGLVNMVKDREIEAEFQNNAAPVEIAQRLIALANENGGRDNITVIVADINPSFATLLSRRLRSLSRRPYAWVIWLLLALAYGGLTFTAGYLVAHAL